MGQASASGRILVLHSGDDRSLVSHRSFLKNFGFSTEVNCDMRLSKVSFNPLGLMSYLDSNKKTDFIVFKTNILHAWITYS